jgi:golgi-specific brefeldin A-resistance guanine nucleotide exchange factor 1
VVARGVKAVSLIYQLTARVPEFIAKSHLEHGEAWATYWSPIFRTLSSHSVNRCREVRDRALSYLQRCLLSASLTSSPLPSGPATSENQSHAEPEAEWLVIFTEVLFPLLFRLLKPEIYAFDPQGMSETRTQAATLLCKVFLHYLDKLVEKGRMLEVWLQVLDVLDRLMNSGAGKKQQPWRGGSGSARGGRNNAVSAADDGGLEEQIPESLKNILLVMSGAGYLVPPNASDNDAAKSPTSSATRPGENNDAGAKGANVVVAAEEVFQSDPDDHAVDEEKKGQAKIVKVEDMDKDEDEDTDHLPTGPRPATQETQIWDETKRRLDRFLPGLFGTVVGSASASQTA